MRDDLEVLGELLVEGLEEVLAVGLGVGVSDMVALSGGAVGQDRDDRPLVRTPSCQEQKNEERPTDL